jgi:hypothetical protein
MNTIPKPGKFDLEKFRVKPPQPKQLDLFEWADQQERLLDAPTYEMGPPSPRPDISGLDNSAAAAAMVQWFFANFEVPEENTPRDDGEWVFIWGGPHEAREELEATFPHATETALDLAVKEIEEDCWEWAPSENRMRETVELALSEYEGFKSVVMATIRKRYTANPPVVEEVRKLLEKLWRNTLTPDTVRGFANIFYLDQTGSWPEGFWTEGRRHG